MFVVGCARSGTTLLKMMLDASPVLAIPPESHFITSFARRFDNGTFDAPSFTDALVGHHRFKHWQLDSDAVRSALLDDPPTAYPDAIRRMYALYATTRGKLRYGDKTPRYLRTVTSLSRLFPESCFLHIVRDGRDVASALAAADWGPSGLSAGALHWQLAVEKGWATARPLGPERYHEIRYEDLVSDTQRVLDEVCRFVDIPFDEAMLHPERKADDVLAGFKRPESHLTLRQPVTKGVRDWRRDLAEPEVALLEGLIGETLAEAGYERQFPNVPRDARRRAAMERVRVRARHSSRRIVNGVRKRLTGKRAR